MVSKVDLLILGLLMDRPMHGYEISQVIANEEISAWLSISLTSIYYALNKLKKNSLIVETVHKSETSPERSVYHLTEKGRATFFDLMDKSLASAERPYFDFDLGVYFINRLPQQRVTQLLDKRRRFLREWAASLEASLAAEHEKAESSPKLVILEHSRAYLKVEQEWLDAFMGEIRQGSRAKSGATEQRSQLMTLFGDLKGMHLPDVLKFIAAGELTGTLTVKQDSTAHTISFRHGVPVYVTAKRDDMALTLPETAMAAIYQVFRWQSGQITFEQGTIVQEGGTPLELRVERLILEGTRQVDSWVTIQRFVPSLETVFEPRPDCGCREMPLNEAERRVVSAIDGVKDVRSVAGGLSLSEFETSKALYTLFAVGALRTVDQDKVRVRRIFRHLAESLYQAVVILGGARTAQECEMSLNGRSKEIGAIRLRQGQVTDDSDPQWEAGQLATAYHSFLNAEVEVIGERLGRNFVQQTGERILREATPDLQEVANRYGFQKVLSRS